MTMTREFYIPKGSKEIKAAKTDAVAYISDYEDGTKYTAMVFGGKRKTKKATKWVIFLFQAGVTIKPTSIITK